MILLYGLDVLLKIQNIIEAAVLFTLFSMAVWIIVEKWHLSY